MKDIISQSACALASAIRNKELSSEEVVTAHLRRIEEVNPAINAVVLLASEQARHAAREADACLARGEIKGPLHGVPITIKDEFETANLITSFGTQGRANFTPAHNETAVQRLLDAGAILLGKTNLPEFSFAFETDNLVFGRTNNPYDLSRSPGASSGGEGAIIAACGSPMGLGSDGGGSIRLPAHFCGIAGIKPTTGRIPKTGHFPPAGGIANTLWQAGPFSRHVEDLSLALSVLCGDDGLDPSTVPVALRNPEEIDLQSLRIAFFTDNGIHPPTRETAAAVQQCARALAELTLVVEEARPQGLERCLELMFGIFGADGGAGLESLIAEVGTKEIHPYLQSMLALLRPYERSAADYNKVLYRLDDFRRDMLAFMRNFDLIISPACAHPAQPHGREITTEMISAYTYTMIYNLAGWPCAVVRAGTSPEGLPIGLQIAARPWREDIVLAVAAAVENITGGWQPPLL
jgi:amidase